MSVCPENETEAVYIAQIIALWEDVSCNYRKQFHARWFSRSSDTVLGEVRGEHNASIVHVWLWWCRLGTQWSCSWWTTVRIFPWGPCWGLSKLTTDRPPRIGPTGEGKNRREKWRKKMEAISFTRNGVLSSYIPSSAIFMSLFHSRYDPELARFQDPPRDEPQPSGSGHTPYCCQSCLRNSRKEQVKLRIVEGGREGAGKMRMCFIMCRKAFRLLVECWKKTTEVGAIIGTHGH